MEKGFQTWREFEQDMRRRYSTFQLSIEELAKDLYLDYEPERTRKSTN